jgi:hypothetical protein
MTKLQGSLALAAMAVALTPKAALLADSGQAGQLHITKECSQYTGAAGSFCTITSSNLAQIKIGTRVYYDQPFNIPTGMLDSNVVLNVGTGDWAVGRCTLDGTTNLGVCTFSDGTGPLTSFHARVNVSPAGGADYHWDGTYSFSSEPDR